MSREIMAAQSKLSIVGKSLINISISIKNPKRMK
jgi:hypothetical protein